MPYPPPPPPPDLGIFQAIGLVPELPTLVGNYFLTNLNGLTVWSPVAGGVLPDETGHGGQFLTTDGFTASWADVSGTSGPANIFDIRNFGAVASPSPNDPSTAIDCAQAFYNAIAAWQAGSLSFFFDSAFGLGGIYVPTGNWWISKPICLPAGCQLYGDGPVLSRILVGKGTTANGYACGGFAGPAIYCSPPYQTTTPTPNPYPTYGASLVGVGGHSLVLDPSKGPTQGYTSYPVTDAYGWSSYLGMGYGSTAVCLRGWVKINTAPTAANGLRGIVGTQGPLFWQDAPTPDRCIGVWAFGDSVNCFLRAYLTTAPTWTTPFTPPQRGTQQFIDSSAFAVGAVVNFEIDYDGAHFDFYLDGVNQGHLSATGPLCKSPMEAAYIGGQGPEDLSSIGGPQPILPINGLVDSIELSRVARHTGTGSFTPPVAKYTADADTLCLYNFTTTTPPEVQPVDSLSAPVGPNLLLPFVMGEAALLTSGDQFSPGLSIIAPQYIRLYSNLLCGTTRLSGLFIGCGFNASGIVGVGTAEGVWDDICVQFPSQYGFRSCDPSSFYTSGSNLTVLEAVGIGIQWRGPLYNTLTVACSMGVQLVGGGRVTTGNDQCSWNSYASFWAGPGESVFSNFEFHSCNNDEEAWQFTRQLAGLVVQGGETFVSSLLCQNNLWAGSPHGSPPVMYNGSVPGWNYNGIGAAKHINDTFYPLSTNAPAGGVYNLGLKPGKVVLDNCVYFTAVVGANFPITNAEDFVALLNADGATNTAGISISDIQANNLGGLFSIQAGFTTGGQIFEVEEADANYIVNITPKSYTGSAPAAGSQRVTGYVTRTDGFDVTVETDPGGTCVATFSYQILRTFGDPLLTIAFPAIPSTHSNPLTTVNPTGNWAAGITLRPVVGNCISGGQGVGTVLEVGTTIGGANYWEMNIGGGELLTHWGNTLNGEVTTYVSGNGRLCGLLNPGPHNIAMGVQGGNSFLEIDGPRGRDSHSSGPASAGTQQTPIYFGERFDTSNGLTGVTLSNFKLDTKAFQVYTIEPDSGPGAQDQGLFFGDDWTCGGGAAAIGFSSLVADVRYGGRYFWIAANRLGAGNIIKPGFSQEGLLPRLWEPWAQLQTQLQAMCLFAGWEDILYAQSATTIMANLQKMLDGIAASASFLPTTAPALDPTSVAGANPNGQAWANFVPPSSGSATGTIGGHAFTSTFTTNPQTTAINTAAALNADVNIGPLIEATAAFSSPYWLVFCAARAIGTAGNGIAVTTNGGGGAFWYTGPFGSGLTFGGYDCTCILQSITLNANWDTDTDTTIDNLIARIVADVTLNPLVTATRVGSGSGATMLVTANTVGTGGNAITCGGNGLNTPPLSFGANPFQQDTLSGGISGAVTNAIPIILFCNIPPIGTVSGVTGAMETQRGLLNTAIAAYCAGSGGAVTLVDLDTLLQDSGTPTNLNPIYDAGGGSGLLNQDGNTAVFVAIAPLLPGTGTPPSALSYATNPASYISGAPIVSNNPTVTGSVTNWTVSPPLPTGLVISASTGHITGTPTTPTAAADYTVAASNEAATIVLAVNITIT